MEIESLFPSGAALHQGRAFFFAKYSGVEVATYGQEGAGPCSTWVLLSCHRRLVVVAFGKRHQPL